MSSRLEALQTASSPADVVRALSALESDPATELEWLARAGGLTIDEVRAAVSGDGDLRPLPSVDAATACTTKAKWTQLKESVVAALQAFHRQEPLLPGAEMESLRAGVAHGLSAKLFRALIDALVGEKVIAREQSLLRLPAHRVALRREEADAAAKSEAMILAGGVTPPSLKEIEAAIAIPRPKLLAVLKQLERERRVTQVDTDLWFGSEALERARSLIRKHIEAHGQIDAATFRDLLGASRKFSIALLDYFDRTGFTMRVGDIRRLRKT
jgi:selenocysteine-specific elongation factor